MTPDPLIKGPKFAVSEECYLGRRGGEVGDGRTARHRLRRLM
jgi:hypothetical protein